MHGSTGPTAWIAPVYPLLLAAVFKVFGTYTILSSWIDLAINSVFGALNCIVLYHIADRLFGRSAALWSAWIWAAFPYCWYWAIHWQWETSLATLLLSTAFLIAIRISWPQAHDRPRRDWLLFGVTNGVIGLTNPSLLLWLPFAGLCALVQNAKRERFSHVLSSATLAALLFLTLLAPWTLRNYRVFGRFIPVRGNFWVEFHLGNTHATDGLWAWWMHPSHSRAELALYRQLGEVRYVQRARAIALHEIAADPAHFRHAILNRILYFWYDTPVIDRKFPHLSLVRNDLFFLSSELAFLGAALMLWRRHRGAFLFATLLIAAPLVYYLTFPHPRYRAPLEPEMVVLSVYLFQSAEKHESSARHQA
ncbi:MAG: hypothetical protein NVS9B15_15870 [Acidobacteriaceae bacterium]